jgi:PAS domain-containing protein
MANAHGQRPTGDAQSVPATEIVRNFPVWQDRSNKRPVTILHHGRPRSVLLSLEQYSQLLMGQGSQDEHGERLRIQLDIILANIPCLFIQVDRNLQVTRANNRATAFFKQSPGSLVGQPLHNLLAEPNAGPVIQATRKVLGIGLIERTSLKTADAELLIDVTPFPAGAALFGTDVAAFAEREELSARCTAEEQLFAMMTGLAIGEVAADGRLTGVHPSLTRLLRFRQEWIGNTPFCDLFDAGSRRKCSLHLAHVLAGKGPVCCRSDIVTRDRDAVPIRLFLAPKMKGETVVSVLFSILDDSLGDLPMR